MNKEKFWGLLLSLHHGKTTGYCSCLVPVVLLEYKEKEREVRTHYKGILQKQHIRFYLLDINMHHSKGTKAQT